MTSEDKKKKLEEVRRLARQGRVKFASQDKVNQTEAFYLRSVLEAIGKVAGNPRIVGALVSDLSCVGDFFHCRRRGEPPCDEVCVCDSEAEEVVLSDILGIEVQMSDYVVDVARRFGGQE
jgi:hypothetical protein